ncbi:hypothetical protein Patl1_07452 [Pistacia atlantica]|uniref:Uncharacterized protein n=1 Tax=Pistacia atlantica TaxID=434234 RepID=A0ACC1ACI4_9ROSI|nr:hypothetical protein Patl1_07452 [Pistacia atlantica]
MDRAIFEDLNVVIDVALHRQTSLKGMKSVVFEKSESLRAAGGGGRGRWRAPLQFSLMDGELWICLALVQSSGQVPFSFKGYEKYFSMAASKKKKLSPTRTIRFGCKIVSLKLDTNTSFPILQLNNGTTIKAKVLIGCDGANSVVADFLDLKPKKLHSSCGVRGFTYFPNGHGFAPEFVQTIRDNTMLGLAPVTDNLAFCFVNHQWHPQDLKAFKDPKIIKQMTLETMKGFPKKMIDVVQNCDLSTLTFSHLRYRAPWDILLGQFRKGTVTVAGDSMHVMTPSIGQGGSTGIEDAVVLARCMARKFHANNDHKIFKGQKIIEEAMDEY